MNNGMRALVAGIILIVDLLVFFLPLTALVVAAIMVFAPQILLDWAKLIQPPEDLTNPDRSGR